MQENTVELPFNSILWNISPIVRETDDDGIVIELQWGWTAGIKEEMRKKMEEDPSCPSGYESVCTTLDFAEDLRDQLTILIDKHKERHQEIRKQAEERFDKKFPKFDELLQEITDKKL